MHYKASMCEPARTRQIRVLLLKLTVWSLITSFYSAPVRAEATGIQACLETYQAAAERQRNDVRAYHRQVEQKTAYRGFITPRHFPKMPGLEGVFTKIGDSYVWGSILTFGALPLTHLAVKGVYELSKYTVSAVAVIPVAAINLAKKAQRSVQIGEAPNPFEEEIELIRDLIQFNEDEIIFSPRFKRIARAKAVRKRFPDFHDVYSILKLTFENRLPCPDRGGFTPYSLTHILAELNSGDLEMATGYKKNLGLPEADSNLDAKPNPIKLSEFFKK